MVHSRLTRNHKRKETDRTQWSEAARCADLRHVMMMERIAQWKESIVANSLTSGTKLASFTDDRNIHVRQSLAANLSLPPETMMELAKKTSGDVHFFLVDNRNVTVEVIEYIAECSQDSWVIEGLASNLKTPVNVLRKLYKQESSLDSVTSYDVAFYTSLGLNPNTPEDILRELSEHESKSVRHHVIANPMTPTDVIQRMTNDKNAGVKEEARKIYMKRRVDVAMRDNIYPGFPREWVEQAVMFPEAENLLTGGTS